MTLAEKNAADVQKSNIKAVGSFSKAFRSNELNNLENGESFVIPENYTVMQRVIGGNTENPAEYINVMTNTGRTVEFYPTAMTRIAFPVDAEGHDVLQDGRRAVVRSGGNLIPFVQGKEINSTMEALKGCTIEYKLKEKVQTRRFGVENEVATKNDIQSTNIGEWNLIGEKKPTGWVG